jgi:hypothetical protein
MRHGKSIAPCAVAVLVAFTLAAHAERWTQASPMDLHVWYDADNVRPTGDHLVGVWISTGPNRTNPGTDGAKSYPTFSVIDCRKRTAGSKLSLDSGQALETYTSDSAMGELIEKLCS